MALLSKGGQDPSYLSRYTISVSNLPGNSAASTKFITHAALLLMSLNTFMVTAGTSTYTNTVTGVGTNTINAQQVSLIVIQNTASAGATAALSTATVGPFIAGGGFVGSGTGTGQVGGVNQFALNTTAGTAGQGGYPVPALAEVYCVSGTDATAGLSLTIDYMIQPGAPLTI